MDHIIPTVPAKIDLLGNIQEMINVSTEGLAKIEEVTKNKS